MFKARKFFIVLLIAVILGSALFYIGFSYGKSQSKNIHIVGVSNINQPNSTGTVSFQEFWDVWQIINDNYLRNDKISNQDKVYGAISGLVNSLKDPYSVFFDPSDFTTFNQNIQGNFGGIGAELGVKNNQIVVISTLENTPAAQAGLKTNDIILAVDGTSTANMSLDQVVSLIRGQVNTPVTLSILRSNWDAPKDFKIIRANIEAPTLDSKEYTTSAGKIIYIHLYAFNANTEYLFSKAIIKALLNGDKGMILDLRGNPGGYLDVAADLAGWFLPRGSVVVREEGRVDSFNQTIYANGNESLVNFPTVILIDGGSASASEILAGALHDDRGIKLIGENSFGKGTVQELIPLPDGSALKLTIAHWVLPNGQILEGKGLTPDIKVSISDQDIQNKQDPQLQKALEVIASEIK